VKRRTLLAASAATAAAAALDAFAIEPRWLDVSRHDVPIEGLSLGLDGFKIAQITDAHLESLGALEECLVAALRKEQVQLLVLTGDIVDSAAKLTLLVELCRELRALGMPIVSTLGNWEHWGKIQLDELARAYRSAGAKLLVDEFHDLGGALGIVATDDSTGGEPRVSRALSSRVTTPATLFLTHSPELFDRVPPGLRFDLSLAGHTHGGQVTLGAVAPALPPGSGRFVAGWYATSLGRAYVSRGTGTSIVPARFACRPELPIFTLKRA
jgi:predicted MPP superfamily phosphohydrolase